MTNPYNVPMSSDGFYAGLPVLDHFPAVCDLANYTELPDDWQIIVADVENSTGAIQAGLYKAVNILGVSVITAVLNETKPLNVPYIFGGDGASLCIPSRLVPQARRALLATQAMAQQSFVLHLRVGIVPVNVIRKAGLRVLVARHRVSKHYVQAAFAGGGIEYAEGLIKDEYAGAAYRLQEPDPTAQADFSGLECRWEAVPSQHGETISLIVKALAQSIETQAVFYDEVIAKVREIYGDDDSCRPVYVDGLKFAYNPKQIRFEAAVRSYARSRVYYLRRLAQVIVQNLLGWVFMTFNMNVGAVPWGDYKRDLVVNTDFRKFDGVLRQVISGNPSQRERMTAWLEERHKKRECVYGIHSSPSAIFTCLISKRHGDHFHFVDGSKGGYAMAAAAMKEQLKSLSA